jgi:hypothetical protein
MGREFVEFAQRLGQLHRGLAARADRGVVFARGAVELHEVLGHCLHVADCDGGARVVHDCGIGRLRALLDFRIRLG